MALVLHMRAQSHYKTPCSDIIEAPALLQYNYVIRSAFNVNVFLLAETKLFYDTQTETIHYNWFFVHVDLTGKRKDLTINLLRDILNVQQYLINISFTTANPTICRRTNLQNIIHPSSTERTICHKQELHIEGQILKTVRLHFYDLSFSTYRKVPRYDRMCKEQIMSESFILS